jgi:hypothetical protein
MKKLLRTIGLKVCSLGWHSRPFEKEPRAEGVTPEEYRFSTPRYTCLRCGVVGRLDVHGNLDPDAGGGATRAAW